MMDSGERDGGRDAAIEARLKAATPGPWSVRRSFDNELPPFVEAPRRRPEDPHATEILGDDTTLYPTRDADVEFIAHAPEDVAYLLAEVERVRAERDAARDALLKIRALGHGGPLEGDGCAGCISAAALASRGARGGRP